ncbi:sensor domain-containing diguanylate cyclase [Stutzerimonas azotifigens]|uniref:diguanylate cyclase n=1 Tax=Stutzerimonas azotifigens TaxID=291995 RepID=A0ABR5YWI4_9GAMM|nr:sensor domain-containing diguanylate cyclase [Stutzerimonas azotifigens]MBA1272283.1 GGDEF domain-containing protein [Stutzerimonas azotifigens]
MPLSTPGRLSRTLFLTLLLLLGTGFVITSLLSYHTSRTTIRNTIVNTELPLTSDTVYSEIQKDLVRPILLSSMMARDTFVRDWVLGGERNSDQMTRYLAEIKEQYGAYTTFFVSENSRTYYQAQGVLKKIDEAEPRDEWYFRIRASSAPYEIEADVDLANQDRLTFFINYRVLDYENNFIGVTGVGLSVEAAVKIIDDYQQRYARAIYFVDKNGIVTLTGNNTSPGTLRTGQSLAELPGLSQLMEQLLPGESATFEYERDNRSHFVNVRYLPELEWYLFVDKQQDDMLEGIRHALLANLVVCLLVIALVMILVGKVLQRYQARITSLASTDLLTELPNRRGFELLAGQALQEARRDQSPLTTLLIDLDHFKQLNDTHGHLAGDEVLRRFAADLRGHLRQSDILCRWGGEEFIVLFKNTDAATGQGLGERIRAFAESRHYTFAEQDITMTVSVGMTLLHANDSLDSLIGRADRALYRAKQSGRNRLCVENEA